MNILVTGASGFIGRPTVARLVAAGHHVRRLVRRDDGVRGERVSTVIGDMTDATSLAAACAGVDLVVHLAARKSDEPDSRAVNVEGARNLTHAARTTGARAIIHISTASVKITNRGIYAATKKEAEEILNASGIPTTTLRPSLVYGMSHEGAFGALLEAAALPIVPVFGNGTWISYPIQVDDIAEIILRATERAEARGKTYDVGGPDAISLNDLLRLLARRVYGKERVRLIHIPASVGIAVARILRRFLTKPPITKSNVLGSTQDIPWDAVPLRRDFGYAPRSLSAGIAELAARHRREEGAILGRYLYSRSGYRFQPTLAFCERYEKALRAHGIAGPMHPLLCRVPALIGPLDAATRLSRAQPPLKRRIEIAAALVECDPQSAPWLLPRDRTLVHLFARSVLLTVSACLKALIGSFTLCIPGVMRSYAR